MDITQQANTHKGIRPAVSVIFPAYNEQGTIGTTLERLRSAAAVDDRLRGSVEAIIISDGSTDATFDKAREALGADIPGEVVQLTRNVGSHAAVRSGLRRARGHHIAIMAADGQDPPEVLAEMMSAFRPGIDVVWGERSERKHDGLITRSLSRTYYWIFRRMTGMDYPPSGYDMVMFSDRVLHALAQYRERNASIFLLIFNLGFGQTSVPYSRGKRVGGSTSWTLRKRVKLGVDMLTAFTAAPIRLVSSAGIVVGMFGLIFGGITVVRGLLGTIPNEGWASLMVVSSLMGGMTLIAIAFIGEYLWRTLDEVRGRPLYLESAHAKEPSDEPHE